MRQSNEKGSWYEKWEKTHPLLANFIWGFFPSLILTVIVHSISKYKISYISLTIALFDLIIFVILAILIFGYYRFFGCQGRITVRRRLSGIGFGLLVAAALFLGTAIFTGNAPTGPYIKASLGTEQIHLYVTTYASNGDVDFSREGNGLSIRFSRDFRVPPMDGTADALLPFEAGILLNPFPNPRKTINISSYRAVVLTLYCSDLDFISNLGFGIKSGDSHEVKYKMSSFKIEQTAVSSKEILVYILLNYYPRAILEQVQSFSIFTNFIEKGGHLEFELRRIAFREKI